MKYYLQFIFLVFTTIGWGQVEESHHKWKEHEFCEYFYEYDLYFPSFLDTTSFYTTLNNQIEEFVGMPTELLEHQDKCPDSLQKYPDFLPELVKTNYTIKTNTSDFLSFYLHRYWHAAGESIGMRMSIKTFNVYQGREVWTLQEIIVAEKWESFKKMIEQEYNQTHKIPLRKPNPQLGKALEWKIQGYTVSANELHIHLQIPHTYSMVHTESITLPLDHCKKFINKRHYHVFKSLK